jgi:hypothetical protein
MFKLCLEFHPLIQNTFFHARNKSITSAIFSGSKTNQKSLNQISADIYNPIYRLPAILKINRRREKKGEKYFLGTKVDIGAKSVNVP